MDNEQRILLEDEWSKIQTSVDETLAALDEELRPLAGRKKALLRQKLTSLDEILGQRRKIAAQLAALEELYPDVELVTSQDSNAYSEEMDVSDKPYENMKVWQAAREVLRKFGDLMSTAEIAERVIAGGKRVADPVSSKISSTLAQRDNIFFSEMEAGHKKMWGLNVWGEEEDDLGGL